MKKTANNNHKDEEKKPLEEKDPKEIKEPQKEETPKIEEPAACTNGRIPTDPDVPPFSDDSKKPQDPYPNDEESPQDPAHQPPIVKDKPDPNTDNNPGDKWDPNDPMKPIKM